MKKRRGEERGRPGDGEGQRGDGEGTTRDGERQIGDGEGTTRDGEWQIGDIQGTSGRRRGTERDGKGAARRGADRRWRDSVGGGIRDGEGTVGIEGMEKGPLGE